MPKRIVLMLLVTASVTLAGCAGPDNSKGRFKVGSPYTIKGVTYYPQENYTSTQTGVASWYGPGFHGKKTANGERFDEDALTAAHPTLQMPSLVRVTNLENGRSIIVRVNDRGPFHSNRVMDVSKGAAEALRFRNMGTARVRLEVLGPESMALAKAAKMGVDTRGSEIAVNNTGQLDARFAAFYPSTVATPQPEIMVASTMYQPAVPPGAIIQTETLAVPTQQAQIVQQTIVTQEPAAGGMARLPGPGPQPGPQIQQQPVYAAAAPAQPVMPIQEARATNTRVYQMAPVLEGEPASSVPVRIEVVQTPPNLMPEKPQFMGVVP